MFGKKVSSSLFSVRCAITDVISLAYLEMRMVLAKMFWQYDLAWFNSDEIDWERDTKGYTLWEKPDLRVMLRNAQTGGV